jgi:hypothetical protein
VYFSILLSAAEIILYQDERRSWPAFTFHSDIRLKSGTKVLSLACTPFLFRDIVGIPYYAGQISRGASAMLWRTATLVPFTETIEHVT